MNVVYPWRDVVPADFAVIGDPVAHSLSPDMHSAAYEILGLSLRYVAVHVPQGEVVQALDHLQTMRFRGINVTVPHKREVLSWATGADDFSIRAEAANTIRLEDRAATNTDAPGFLDTIQGVVNPGASVLMIGAGGSARALAIVLVEAGFQLKIQNRTRQRAEDVANVSGATVVDDLDPAGAELIVNTTSASLQGEQLPVLWDHAEPGTLAYDLAYAPNKTPFMTAAEAHGLKAIDGRDLLVAQGARSFEWWLGTPAPREVMRRALR